MSEHREMSALERLGCQVSSWVSDVSAHPFAQISVIVTCGLWFAFGFVTDLLTAILSILAITLAQMVLNRQNEREADDHRRDIAMHAKLDELLIAMKGARDEMAGIEDLDEEDIAELKDEVKQSIEQAGAAAGGARQRHHAKHAAAIAVEKVARKGKARGG